MFYYQNDAEEHANFLSLGSSVPYYVLQFGPNAFVVENCLRTVPQPDLDSDFVCTYLAGVRHDGKYIIGGNL